QDGSHDEDVIESGSAPSTPPAALRGGSLRQRAGMPRRGFCPGSTGLSRDRFHALSPDSIVSVRNRKGHSCLPHGVGSFGPLRARNLLRKPVVLHNAFSRESILSNL